MLIFVLLILGPFLLQVRKRRDIPTVLASFPSVTIYRDTKTIYQAQYRKNDEVAHIEIRQGISKEAAAQTIQSKIDLITSLYEKRPVSYPDVITNEIACAEKYRPILGERKNNDTAVRYLVGSATRRFTFGACSDDLIAYKALVAWYWCGRTKSLVQLELMVPKTDTNALNITQDALQSFSCQ